MNSIIKFIISSSPLQGFRLVDTFPWLMLLTPKSPFMEVKVFQLAVASLLLLVATLLLGTSLESTLKLSCFCFFIIIIAFSRRLNFRFGVKDLVVILLLLALEDLIINIFGVLSPFVRDERGALFIFREKSYVALFVGFLISYLPTTLGKAGRDLIILAAVFYFLESGIGWLIYAIYCYHRLQINLTYLPRASVVFCFSIISLYLVLAAIGSEAVSFLVNASDLLRLLINLESLNLVNTGSFYLHDASVSSGVGLDISRGYLKDWVNITPQSPFFLIAYFFGYYGYIVSGIFFAIYIRAVPRCAYNSTSFIHSMILLNLMVQGFLLSPYLMGYLFIIMPRGKVNDFNCNR